LSSSFHGPHYCSSITYSRFTLVLLTIASGTTTTRSRYFNVEITTANAAAAFSSAAPVPVSPFWDDIDYSSARKYLDNFSQYELPQLPIGPNSADKPTAKLQLLLRLLQEKLTKDEAEAATSPPNFLHGANCTRWYDLWQAIYTIQSAAGFLEAAGVTARMLVVWRPDDSTDVRPRHLLAEHLVAVSEYAEVEETAQPVCAWMNAQPRLDKGSPQAISARRVIARAL
jgi:hypothetical protein